MILVTLKLDILSFFFSSRRRHTRWPRDWSSDVCSSDLPGSGPSQPAMPSRNATANGSPVCAAARSAACRLTWASVPGSAESQAASRACSSHPLMPFRVLRSRDRSGAYLISLCVGTALVSMFFFLTLFVQEVWGYSALRTAAAYLPFVPAVLATTAVAQQGVSRIGARPLLITGSAVAAGGMFWASRLTEHSTFAGGLLGPELLLGAGLGPLFVLIFLVGLIKVNNNDTGVASGLVNIGQQVGGAIGLAIVGTVAWSAVASTRQSAAAAAAAAQAGAHPSAAQAAALKAQIGHHALATGFSQGYLVSAGVLLLSLVIALFMMRVSRADLSGPGPAPEPAGDASSPGPA